MAHAIVLTPLNRVSQGCFFSRSLWKTGCVIASIACLSLTSCSPSPPATKPAPAQTIAEPSLKQPASDAAAKQPAAEPFTNSKPADSTAAGDIIISAAASTKDVMEALAAQFTATTHHKVSVNAGASSNLATQILNGAPADLFLSANQSWADKVKEGGQAEQMDRLLTNRLVIVVPQGNPSRVHKPDDFTSDRVKKIALAGEKVPAGMYADQALKKLGLLDSLVAAGKIARGQDVRSALSYVELGEAEAGIVYSTDVVVSSKVESVYDFDPSLHDEIVYVLVLLKHGTANPTSRAFYDFLRTDKANEVLKKAGFGRVER